MVGRRLTVFASLLAALIMFVAAGAQEKMPAGQGSPPLAKPYPVGQVTITWKAIGGRGIGVEWGDGILDYAGKQYTFKIKGVQAVMAGVKKVTAHGEVYNLFDIGQFPGRYAAVGAGLAIFKGKEGMAFKNSQGVHILLKAEEKGVAIEAGPGGFTIKLEEAL